jgi:hypothetical protein
MKCFAIVDSSSITAASACFHKVTLFLKTGLFNKNFYIIRKWNDVSETVLQQVFQAGIKLKQEYVICFCLQIYQIEAEAQVKACFCLCCIKQAFSLFCRQV